MNHGNDIIRVQGRCLTRAELLELLNRIDGHADSSRQQIARDWRTQHGGRLELPETFVEIGRFTGTADAAANWQPVRATTGRTRQEAPHQPAPPRTDSTEPTGAVATGGVLDTGRPQRYARSCTRPAVPSTRTRWPLRRRESDSRTDITAGSPISRAVTAPCERGPPLSVMMATAV